MQGKFLLSFLISCAFITSVEAIPACSRFPTLERIITELKTGRVVTDGKILANNYYRIQITGDNIDDYPIQVSAITFLSQSSNVGNSVQTYLDANVIFYDAASYKQEILANVFCLGSDGRSMTLKLNKTFSELITVQANEEVLESTLDPVDISDPDLEFYLANSYLNRVLPPFNNNDSYRYVVESSGEEESDLLEHFLYAELDKDNDGIVDSTVSAFTVDSGIVDGGFTFDDKNSIDPVVHVHLDTDQIITLTLSEPILSKILDYTLTNSVGSEVDFLEPGGLYFIEITPKDVSIINEAFTFQVDTAFKKLIKITPQKLSFKISDISSHRSKKLKIKLAPIAKFKDIDTDEDGLAEIGLSMYRAKSQEASLNIPVKVKL